MARNEMLIAPAGLKGLIVADTEIGEVRGQEGFFHYRQYNAAELATAYSFEAITALLLDGAIPDEAGEAAVTHELGSARRLDETSMDLVEHMASGGMEPSAILRAVMVTTIDPTPTLDQSRPEVRAAVMAAIGLTPTVLAAAHRIGNGLSPVTPDPARSHAADLVTMITGEEPTPEQTNAVQTYLSLTADHGFNASTFTARVITSTGANVGGVLVGAIGALSGPLHGGAPSRVLDMLAEIGDPANTEKWATTQLDNGHKLMGFGHAVYRAEDPRGVVLRSIAEAMGGELVDRAIDIEARMLATLRARKPDATIVTNVEYYAAVVLALSGIPQEMFTAVFTSSRMVGWSAHILEQSSNNKIMRPSARYVGPAPKSLLATTP